jgi:CubicO group peptidase (beta-lactamase class C family)
MTKPLAAVAILMVLEEGGLDLNDPVSRFIPELGARRMVRVFASGVVESARSLRLSKEPSHDLVPANREITVKDLLTHTSGLQSVGMPNPAIPMVTAADTLATWVTKLAGVPLDFQPGTQWAYSSVAGFDVLARVVEVSAGLRFDEFLQRRLFDPLGMTHSGFGIHLRRPTDAAPLSPMLANDPRVAGTSYFSGSGGLWMNALDYTRFAQMLANGGSFEGRRILEAGTVALMASNHAKGLFSRWADIGNGAQMGLGVLVIVDPASAGLNLPGRSFGWDGVGRHRFWVVPDLDMVIVMLLPGGNAAPVHRSIEKAVTEAIEE